MDVIRLDDPPRVTLIDFKSGEAGSDLAMKLDEEEMKLQIMLYGLAAKRELEYEPDLGLVRYLDSSDGDPAELRIPLNTGALAAARQLVSETAESIRRRGFDEGPRKRPRTDGFRLRCQECDYKLFCDHAEAAAQRAGFLRPDPATSGRAAAGGGGGV